MIRRPLIPGVFATALLLGLACAGNRPVESDPGVPAVTREGPVIEVLNNQWNAIELRVLIQNSLRFEEELGTVSPGGTVIFAFDGDPGQYRLRVVGRQSTWSRWFRINPDSHIRWDLQTGFLTERRRR